MKENTTFSICLAIYFMIILGGCDSSERIDKNIENAKKFYTPSELLEENSEDEKIMVIKNTESLGK